MTRQSSRRSGAVEVDRSEWLELDVPVFRPTLEEFRDFHQYLKKVEQTEEAKFGLVKVIPPYEQWSWKMEPNQFDCMEEEQTRAIKPIKQFVGGRKGAYRLDLMNSKKRTVEQFRNDAAKHDSKRPSLSRQPEPENPTLKGEVFSRDGKLVWKGMWAKQAAHLDQKNQQSYPFEFMLEVVSEDDRSVWKGYGWRVKDEDGLRSEEDLTLYALPHGLEKATLKFCSHPTTKCHVEGHSTCSKASSGGQTVISGEFEPVNSTGSGASSPTSEKSDEDNCVDASIGTLILWLSDTQGSKIFDLDAVSKELWERDWMVVENGFWDSMGSTTTPPIYGGDQSGTVFGDADANGWNLNKLDTLLRLGFGDKQAKGISTSMLYFGMWRAMFAWHTEDMELNSVNFLHYGAPKLWYGVPPEYAHRFETVARAEFGDEANRCKEFLRHKNIMISPAILKREKIPYVRAIQYPGEFMFTFPRTYHGGFNCGFNVAEAVNFATARWIDYGRKAKWCKCEKWTFRLDVDSFVDAVRETRPEVLPETPVEGEKIWVNFHNAQQYKKKRSRTARRNTLPPRVVCNIMDDASKSTSTSRSRSNARGRGRGSGRAQTHSRLAKEEEAHTPAQIRSNPRGRGGSRGRGGGRVPGTRRSPRAKPMSDDIQVDEAETTAENQTVTGTADVVLKSEADSSHDVASTRETAQPATDETIPTKTEQQDTPKRPRKRPASSQKVQSLIEEQIDDSTPVVVGEEDADLLDWFLCRVRKGTRGVKFLAVPIDKDTCPYTEIPFDPVEAEWKWPFSFDPRTELELRKNQRAKNKRLKGEQPQSKGHINNGIETSKLEKRDRQRKQKDKEEDDPERQKFMEHVRRIKWNLLRHTRKIRLMRQKAKLFLRMHHFIATINALQPPVKQQRKPLLLDQKRIIRLQRLDSSRDSRLERRKKKALSQRISSEATAVLADVVDKVCCEEENSQQEEQQVLQQLVDGIVARIASQQ